MRILGISSATKTLSIGLVDDDRVLAETTISGAQSEKILFYVKEAGIKPKEIEGIAVAIGPGSYAGLRGGLATAKTLAQVMKCPLVGVPTLEAIAYNLVDIEGAIAVILDAKADDYNFALFGASAGKLKRLTGDLVVNYKDLVKKLLKISGDIWINLGVQDVKAVKELKMSLKGGNFHFSDGIHSYPYGINVAKLGAIKIKSGEKIDPRKLMPVYSHKPNIREYKMAS